MSVVFAASHPERVSALVLYGGMARTLWAPDYLFGETERESRKGIEEELEEFVTPGGTEAKARRGFPSADEEEVQAIARVIRYGASPGTVEALERMNIAIDVRDVLPMVSAPTLVVQQRGDPWTPSNTGATSPSTSRGQRMWNWTAMTTFPPLPWRRSCWPR